MMMSSDILEEKRVVIYFAYGWWWLGGRVRVFSFGALSVSSVEKFQILSEVFLIQNKKPGLSSTCVLIPHVHLQHQKSRCVWFEMSRAEE